MVIRHMLKLFSISLLFWSSVQNVHAQQSFWDQAMEQTSCETTRQLDMFLENGPYVCIDGAGPAHSNFVNSTIRSGYNSCYIGTGLSYIAGLEDYQCSVVAHPLGYRSLFCARLASDTETLEATASLSERPGELYRVSDLRNACTGPMKEVSFGGPNQVPLDVHQYFEHEFGLVMGGDDRLLYTGVGNAGCFFQENHHASGKKLATLTYFFGSAPRSNLMSETDRSISEGVILVNSRLNQFDELANASFYELYRRGLADTAVRFSSRAYGVGARPSPVTDNLETLLRLREIDLADLFEDSFSTAALLNTEFEKIDLTPTMISQLMSQVPQFDAPGLDCTHPGMKLSIQDISDGLSVYTYENPMHCGQQGVLVMVANQTEGLGNLDVFTLALDAGCANGDRVIRELFDAFEDHFVEELEFELEY